jgi:hypothetical protein
MKKWLEKWVAGEKLEEGKRREEFWRAESVERDELLKKRLDKMALMQPLTRVEILNGLARGMDDPAVKSVLAVVRGLREVTVRQLSDTGTSAETAAMLRGKLTMVREIEEMLGACWADLERTRKAEAKGEK